jgi:NAD(P)-dependent dehydrogenase (short-subunit alcohol dehydrogenase family)
VLGRHRTRANVVSPGTIPTPGYDQLAKAVSFLASDDSSFVNGIELFVDGGMAQI